MTTTEPYHDNASCKTVLAGTIAKQLVEEVALSLKALSNTPLLVGFLANDDTAARSYADWTRRTCEEK